MKIIAHMYTDFDEKFGIPRQSGLVEGAKGRIVFEPEYRVRDAFRGLENYSHLWILWQFSESIREDWSPTVRPPRLGGNRRMGVFATRSPFRPNPIGLSSVRLDEIRYEEAIGPVLIVSGIDMLNETPIYDIKPYLAYCDSHVDAVSGFADQVREHALEVTYEPQVVEGIKKEILQTICELLRQDPRTAYVEEEDRVWGMSYGGYNVQFKVKENVLCIVALEKI